MSKKDNLSLISFLGIILGIVGAITSMAIMPLTTEEQLSNNIMLMNLSTLIFTLGLIIWTVKKIKTSSKKQIGELALIILMPFLLVHFTGVNLGAPFDYMVDLTACSFLAFGIAWLIKKPNKEGNVQKNEEH